MNAQPPLIANEFGLNPTQPDPTTGEQLSALFENKEYLAGYLKAKERERMRFSRELHAFDRPIACRIAAGRLENLPARPQLVWPKPSIDVQSDAHLIEDQVRALAFLFRHYPAQLSRDGLPVALRSYVTGFGKRTGIRTSFRVEGECGYLKCEPALAR